MSMRLINSRGLAGALRRHWHAAALLGLLALAASLAQAPPSATSLPQAPTATSAPPAVSGGAEVFLPLVRHADGSLAARPPPTAPPPSPTLPPTAGPQRSLADCAAYRNIRITWYELGSCCGKAPDHPQYGITRSGLQVQWGMAAVQATRPLFPIGTRFIVGDIGPRYVFTVTDTGSETAFGSNWIDIYAPSIELGLLVERTIGRDGRSDVYVCPEQ